MIKIFFITAVLFLFAGCKDQNQIQTRDTVKREVKADSIKEPVRTDIFEGIYITNLNTNSFIDCANPDSVYWVTDDSKKLEAQYKKMFSTPSVYNSVLIKVKGELEETKEEPRKEKYPTTLRVKDVIYVEKKNYSNTCVPYDFWALGNGNSWSLEISKQENLIEFIVPGEDKSYYFFYAEPVEENGFTIYRNYNYIQRYTIEIRIKRETCSDKTSDKVYDYSVEVKLSDNKKYKGCGIKGKG